MRRSHSVMSAFMILWAIGAYAQVGELDHRFASHGYFKLPLASDSQGYENGYRVAVYPSTSASHAGKTVIVGDYTATGNVYKTQVIRLTAAGALDTTFNSTGRTAFQFANTLQNSCRTVLIQSDDKILVLVEHRESSGIASYAGLVRYNANGTLDTSFSSDGMQLTPAGAAAFYAYDMAIQKNGKIVICGNTGTYDSCIVRMDSDGANATATTVNMTGIVGGSSWQELAYGIALDNGLSGEQNIYVTGTVMTADGSKYTGMLLKFDKNCAAAGNTTFEFGTPGCAGNDIVFHDFGGSIGEKLVVGGGQGGTSYVGFSSFGVAMFDTSLSLYTGFSTDGKVTVTINGGSTRSELVAVQSDGEIIVGGEDNCHFVAARYTTAGNLDTTFTADGVISYLVPNYGSAGGFCLNNSGDIAAACTPYSSDWASTSLSCVTLHTADKAMEIASIVPTQKSEQHAGGQTAEILSVPVCVDGSTSPLNVTSMTFNTNGSTAPATDVATATLYYTGALPSFHSVAAGSEALGSAVASPNGSFTFDGFTKNLTHGDQYFWLVYKLVSGAALADTVDAECTSVMISGAPTTPTPTAPANAWTVAAAAYPTVLGIVDYDYLKNVAFAGINNTSTGTSGGYADYTSQTGAVTTGLASTFSCTLTGAWPDYPSKVLVWIDWNQNKSFYDAGEYYLVGQGITTEGPHTLDITPPSSALAGTTRMRVIGYCDTGEFPNHGDLLFGEAEEYSLTVTKSNQAPVITESDPAAVTMSEDSSPTAFSLTLNATDADSGDTLTWSISTPASHGTASASGTGTSKAISYAPAANYNGPDSFVVQVSDGTATDTITINVTINAVNDAPVITESDPVAVTMSEDGSPTAFSLTLNATDADIADTLTWSIFTPATHGTAAASGTGTSKAISYAPAANYNGPDSFVVQVSDGTATDTITVNVTINAVNDAPVITQGAGPLTVTMSEDGVPTAWSAPTLGATDADTGDTLTWSVSSAASHGMATVSGTGASPSTFTYAPTANWSGSDSFSIQVSDGNGGTDSINVEVTVTSSPDLIAEYDFAGNLLDDRHNSTLTAFGADNDGNNHNNAASEFATDAGIGGDTTYWRWTSTLSRGGGFWIDLDGDLGPSYSVGVRFSFDATGPGWRKIMDYNNMASDEGFYFYNDGKLAFYPYQGESLGISTISNEQIVDVVATRDEATGVFTAYMIVNGSLTKEFEVDDLADGYAIPAVVSGSSRIGFFFDDNDTSSEASPGGKVYAIKIWDSPISQADVQTAMDPAKAITSFAFESMDPDVAGIINEGEKTITVGVPEGTNVTALAPTITHTGAGVSPASGTPQDFTAPVVYTITAADGTTADYTVTVKNEYTLTYTHGPNGSLTGATSQTVFHGNDGTAVEAVPDEGYDFARWSDSVTDNPRTDRNVTGDISVSAVFTIHTGEIQ